MKKKFIRYSDNKIVIVKKAWIILFVFIIGCSKSGKYHSLRWSVGQWVSYKINDKPIRVSIVGRESSNKAEDELSLYWVETVEPELVVKVLVEEGKLDKARKLIIKKVSEAPFEVQVDNFHIKSEFPSLSTSELGKEELLTLPCGKFRVFHKKENGEDVWLSNKVPIFGIVKYKSKNKEIVLWDYGIKGAKSEIKGEVKIVHLEEAS